MRLIKFRAKALDGGAWTYGNPIILLDKTMIAYSAGDDNVLGQHTYKTERVDSETVGQFTGLRDNNGFDIYEGDILMQNSDPKDLGEVCFGEYGVRDIETEGVVDNAVGWYLKVIKTDAMSEMAPFCYDRVLNEFWIEKLNAIIVDDVHSRTETIAK